VSFLPSFTTSQNTEIFGCDVWLKSKCTCIQIVSPLPVHIRRIGQKFS
jgi:hypothetical protein